MLRGFAGRVNLNHDSRHWGAWANFDDLNEDFRADAGFVPRVDTRTYNSGVQRSFWGEDNPWFTWFAMSLEGTQTEDHSGTVTDQQLSVAARYNGPWQSARKTM